MEDGTARVNGQETRCPWPARLQSGAPLAEILWILLVVLIPLSAEQRRSAPFLIRLFSLPGMLELGLVIASGLIVLLAVRRSPRKFASVLGSPWLLPLAAYSGLGLLAAGFSRFRLPALAYSVELIVGLLLSVIVFAGLNGRRGLTGLPVLWLAAGILCGWAALGWAIDPASAWILDGNGAARLSGAGLHPNHLGFAAALLGIGGMHSGLTAKTARRKAVAALMVMLALVILLATRSRADIAGFVGGALTMLLVGGKWRWVAASVAGPLAAALLSPRLTAQVGGFVSRGLDLQLGAGRLAIWRYLIQHSLSSWKGSLLGHGIGTSALMLRRAVPQWPFPAHAHSLLVEALNNAGIPGVALVLTSLATVAYGVILVERRRVADPWLGRAMLAIFVLVLCVSAVENSFAGRANIYGFTYWALAAMCSAHLSSRPGSTDRVHPDDGA